MTPESTLTENDWNVYIACVGDAYGTEAIFSLVMEMQVVSRKCENFAEAVLQFFALHYVLDLCYACHKNHTAYFFECMQKMLFILCNGKLSPRLTTFVNKVQQVKSRMM